MSLSDLALQKQVTKDKTAASVVQKTVEEEAAKVYIFFYHSIFCYLKIIRNALNLFAIVYWIFPSFDHFPLARF
jgi:hypothetical protein